MDARRRGIQNVFAAGAVEKGFRFGPPSLGHEQAAEPIDGTLVIRIQPYGLPKTPEGSVRIHVSLRPGAAQGCR